MNELLLEQKGAALWLTINREPQRNSLTDSLLRVMAQAIEQAPQQTGVKLLVITGSGERAFCAGADLKAARAGQGPFQTNPADDSSLVTLFKAIENCQLPVIGRINGHALGGGLGLVCMCDLALGVSTARLGTPEAKVGVWPMMILPYLLRILPYRKVLELALTAEPWNGERAAGEGLLNQVFVTHAAMDEALDALINQIAANSPLANRIGKKALHAMHDMSHEQALTYAQLVIEKMSATADAQEGMLAFSEKRLPRWPSEQR